MTGVVLAEAGGHTLLRDLRLSPAPASNVLLAPREVRRELLVGGRSVTETVVLPERSPGLVVQWVAGPGARAALQVGFRLPARGMRQDSRERDPADLGRRRYRAEGELLRVDGPNGAVRLYRLSPAPEAWAVEEEGSGSEAWTIEEEESGSGAWSEAESGEGSSAGAERWEGSSAGAERGEGSEPRSERGEERGKESESASERGEERGPTVVATVGGPEDGRPVTLIVALGGSVEEAAAALSTASRAAVHEVRAERALATSRAERVALHTGVSELDDALEWAKARLDGAGVRPGPPTGRGAAAGTSDGRGNQGARGREPLRRALLALGYAAAGFPERAAGIAGELAPETAPALLASAWVTAWTGVRPAGRPDGPKEAAEALLAASGGQGGGSATDRVLSRAAVAAAADLLDSMGDRKGGDALRGALPEGPVALGPAPPPEVVPKGDQPFPGGLAPGRSRLPLPMAGGPGDAFRDGPGRGGASGHDDPGQPGPSGRHEAEERLRAALLGVILGVPTRPAGFPDAPDPSRAFDPSRASDAGPVDLALEAWALFAAGHPDPGYLRLRRHLAGAFEDVAGCWSDPDGGLVDDPVAAALVPVVVLHGLLGARPDAPYGRLRLAPAFPAAWTSCRVTGIRLGDVVLELAYRAGKGRRTFVVRPTAGSVPPTLVFEPTVPGAVAAVEVDGQPADVEPEPTGDRTVVRLQIPVDRERRIVLVGTDG